MQKIVIFLALFVIIAATYAAPAPADENVAVEVTDPAVTVVAGATGAETTTVNPNKSSSEESNKSVSSSEEKKKVVT